MRTFSVNMLIIKCLHSKECFSFQTFSKHIKLNSYSTGGTYDDTAAIEVGMGARAILPSFLATNYIRKGVLQSGTILSNADCQTAYDAATPTQTIDSHHICVSLADEHQACEVSKK